MKKRNKINIISNKSYTYFDNHVNMKFGKAKKKNMFQKILFTKKQIYFISQLSNLNEALSAKINYLMVENLIYPIPLSYNFQICDLKLSLVILALWSSICVYF